MNSEIESFRWVIRTIKEVDDEFYDMRAKSPDVILILNFPWWSCTRPAFKINQSLFDQPTERTKPQILCSYLRYLFQKRFVAV